MRIQLSENLIDVSRPFMEGLPKTATGIIQRYRLREVGNSAL